LAALFKESLIAQSLEALPGVRRVDAKDLRTRARW